MDTKRIFKKAVNLLTLSSFLLWNLSVAAPEGGSVAQGSATISQSGAQTTINQSSQNAVINWNSFNTASHEAVQFNQPNASSVALNRITNGLPTQFAGSLNANGQVWILNPAGVLFTNTARVDVAGLVATTHGILDSNFMSGNYRFDLVPGSEYASIINNGLISAKDSGIVALVAPHVANNGLIQANLGKVSLSSGAAYTLDMYGDSLINFGSNAPIQNGTVSNAGNIIANGGKVYMTANYASGVLDNMISMSGTVQAKSVGVNQKGEIVLYGGDYQAKKMSGVTKVSGKLKVSSDDKSIGGFIETSGGYVEIAPAAEIDAGMGGTWLLDPWNITVVAGSGLVNNGGATGFVPSGTNSQIGANLINAQLGAGTNVILDTNSVGGDVGNITISSPVTWSTAAVLTLIANNNIAVNAALNGSTTGFVSLQAGGSITGAGVISANTLTTSSVTGLSLTGLNTAANFNATNTTSGNIAYTHTGALNITGITQNVGNLTISNTGAITQSGPISVSGTSSFTAGAGAITLNDPANNLVGAVTFSNTGANNVSIVNNPNLILGASTIGGSFSASTNASSITLNGNITSGVGQTYNDPLLINANLTLTSTAGVLIFTSTIDDTALRSHTLTLASPGLVVFGGAVGGTTALNTLNLTQNSFTVDPTLASFIAGQLNVGTNVRLTSTAGDVTIGSPITQTISVVPITLSLVASNLINLNSSISLLPGSTLSLRQPSFTVDPTLATYIVGQLNAGTNVTLNSSATTITVSSPITQTVNNGNVTLSMLATTALNINQPITLITGGAFIVTAPSGINLGASISTGLAQTYNNPITLTGGPVTLTSTSGSISSGTINGNFDLTLNAATTVTFSTISGLASLVVTALGGIISNSTVLSVIGNLTLNNDITLPGSGTISTTGGGNISIQDALGTACGTCNFSLTVSAGGAPGATLLLNKSLNSNNLILSSTGMTTLMGGALSSRNAITVTGPITFTQNVLLTTRFSGVTFNGDVLGPGGISGNIAFNGGFGTQIIFGGRAGTVANPLAFISIPSNDSGGFIRFLSSFDVVGAVTVSDNANFGSGAILFDGFGTTSHAASVSAFAGGETNATTNNQFVGIRFNGVNIVTTGNQAYNTNGAGGIQGGGLSILTGDVTLTSTGGTVSFASNGFLPAGSAISSDSAGTPRNLTINGNASFGTIIGGGTNAFPLNNLTVTGLSTFSSNASSVTTVLNQTYNSATFTSSPTLTSQAGSILFGGVVNGGGSLSLSVPNLQSITFNGTVGGTTALTSITTSATGATYINGGQVRTSSGAQNWNNQVYISADTILGGVGTTGAININLALDSFNSTPRALTLTTTGMTFLNGNLGATNILSGLTVTNAATLNVNSIYTTTFQNYNGALTLTGSSNLFTNAGGAITFGSTIQGGFNLSANASSTGTVNFNNDIGTVGTPLTGLTVTGLANINANVAPTIFVSGTQTYNNNVLLNSIAAITFGSGIGSTTVFNGTVNRTVTSTAITIAGNLQVGPLGSIGLSSVIASLLVNGSTLGPNVTTAGNQTYVGPVTLNTDETMTSTSGNITFNDTVDGDGFVGHNLVLNAVGVTFNGLVGNVTPLASLNVVSGLSHTNINTTAISTTGAQNYSGTGDVLVNAPVSMTFTGSDIIFSRAVENVTVPATDLFIVGNLVLDGPAGSIYGVFGGFDYFNSLTVSGSTTVNNPNFVGIQTLSNQTYNGQVILNAGAGAVGFAATQVGSITFNSTIDGARNMIVVLPNPLSVASFNGIVGGVTPLSQLTVSGSSSATTNINTSAITTTGAQTYGTQVALGSDTVLTSTADGIIFSSTVDSDGTPRSLTLDAFNPTVLMGNIGSINPLSTLHIINETDINTGIINTTVAQLYDGVVILGANAVLTSNPGGIVTFGSTIDSDVNGPWDLTVNTSEARFKGNIGSSQNSMGALTVNSDIINFDGNVTSVVTSGAQTYTGATAMTIGVDPLFMAPNFVINIPLVILADTTYTSTAGDIDFQSTVDGPANLVLNPFGTVIFQGDVGSGVHLGSLTVNGPSSILGAANIITDGDQLYTGVMTLNNNLSMEAFGTGKIMLGDQNGPTGGVSGPSYNLTVVTHDASNGPTGAGITGIVAVNSLTLGGEGGANLSFNYPTSESFVTAQGAGQAIINTVISPDFRTSGAIYCVNNFCSLIPVPNPPSDIPPLEIIPKVGPPSNCNASGCENLFIIIDNLIPVGVITCAGINGCSFGYTQAEDMSGVVRMLMPGDLVYAGDRILKEKDTCACIKSLINNKKICLGPKEREVTYYR